MTSSFAIDLTPYAGRWVALIQGQVAGVGETPEAARRLAQHNRPKERLALRYVEASGGEPLALPPLLADLRPFFAELDIPVYLVGGAVRDALLGRPGHDLDFVVPDQAIRLAFKVADFLHRPAYVLDQERDAGRVVLREADTTLDFSRFRGPDLAADLQDRDFTVNAMALPATAVTQAALVDPHGGLADLAARRLRLVQPEALAHDPVRALRAIRQCLTLDLSLTPETGAAVRAAAPLLSQASIERVRDELLKLFNTAVPHQALSDMWQLGVLAEVLPEIAALDGVAQSPPHLFAVLPHTVQVLRWLALVETAVVSQIPTPDDSLHIAQQALAPYAPHLAEHLARPVDGSLDGRVLLRLGALFHDVGKKATQTIEADGRIRFLGHDGVGAAMANGRLRQLCLSNQAIKHVEVIVAGHMRPLQLAGTAGLPSRRAIYRYFQATQTAGLDIGLLSLADHLATYDGPGPMEIWAHLVNVVARLLRHYFDHHADTIAPPPLLDGHELARQLQLKPGPEIGRLLRLIREAQAAGEIHSREEALALAWDSKQ
ncbi:MAG: HDIG domain-containing protein [Chloroflexi bacterium]|nr:HDIG domain-containing protein [Chloroflexota bacterium]